MLTRVESSAYHPPEHVLIPTSRERAMADLEKLTINLTPVDLGKIELLVEQGFYANRAEFIRVAIRNELGKHEETVRETTRRQAFIIGAVVYGRRMFEELREKKQRLNIRVVGFLSIA